MVRDPLDLLIMMEASGDDASGNFTTCSVTMPNDFMSLSKNLLRHSKRSEGRKKCRDPVSASDSFFHDVMTFVTRFRMNQSATGIQSARENIGTRNFDDDLLSSYVASHRPEKLDFIVTGSTTTVRLPLDQVCKAGA